MWLRKRDGVFKTETIVMVSIIETKVRREDGSKLTAEVFLRAISLAFYLLKSQKSKSVLSVCDKLWDVTMTGYQ